LNVSVYAALLLSAESKNSHNGSLNKPLHMPLVICIEYRQDNNRKQAA